MGIGMAGLFRTSSALALKALGMAHSSESAQSGLQDFNGSASLLAVQHLPSVHVPARISVVHTLSKFGTHVSTV